jgi:hypothetical protein
MLADSGRHVNQQRQLRRHVTERVFAPNAETAKQGFGLAGSGPRPTAE